MSELRQEVRRMLDAGGALARTLPQFHVREGQLAMADAVARVVEEGGSLVVEAGTGTGKTFAYLIPALLSGRRVLISTATKALQEQLVHRDLPRLQEILARHAAVYRRVALLKGRANYLCLHRLELWLGGGMTPRMAQVKAWAQSTPTGDLAEVGALELDAHQQAQITSTRDNCLGGQCPRFAACHVYRARRLAIAADVAVVNHHLFFADMAGLDDGESELLSHARVVIFDEAHSLNHVGQQALGQQFSTRQLTALAQDVAQAGQSEAQGWRDWPALAQALHRAAQGLREAAIALPENTRIAWVGSIPDGVDAAQWACAWKDCQGALRLVLQELDAVTTVAADLARLHERTVDLLQVLTGLSLEPDDVQVRWLSCGLDDVQFMQTPYQIAPQLQHLWQTASPDVAWLDEGDAEPVAVGVLACPQAPEVPEVPRSFVFTSATLGNNEALDWFTTPLGLHEAQVLRLASPFDYGTQASLYVPEHLPAANDPRHAAQLGEWLAEAIRQLGGRTLVLTTSLRAMHVIADVLGERLADAGHVELLVQGRHSRSHIAERFQSSGAQSLAPGCVLVASQSYWQGFDVPGEALQMVVVDKLPFPVPSDPLVEAYSTYLERQGRNPFKDYALQEAAIALRQGAGRLIRSETDAGLLVVADARLKKGYGKWLQRQLPPMRVLDSEESFQAALDALARQLTRVSTRDHPSS